MLMINNSEKMGPKAVFCYFVLWDLHCNPTAWSIRIFNPLLFRFLHCKMLIHSRLQIFIRPNGKSFEGCKHFS